ncbi:TPA: hypothetical protein ACIYZQ_004014 [Escherichia coli]
MGRWWRYKWITFHPSLTEGEGELKELSLSELEERALMYAADSFRYE